MLLIIVGIVIAAALAVLLIVAVRRRIRRKKFAFDVEHELMQLDERFKSGEISESEYYAMRNYILNDK